MFRTIKIVSKLELLRKSFPSAIGSGNRDLFEWGECNDNITAIPLVLANNDRF